MSYKTYLEQIDIEIFGKQGGKEAKLQLKEAIEASFNYSAKVELNKDLTELEVNVKIDGKTNTIKVKIDEENKTYIIDTGSRATNTVNSATLLMGYFYFKKATLDNLEINEKYVHVKNPDKSVDYVHIDSDILIDKKLEIEEVRAAMYDKEVYSKDVYLPDRFDNVTDLELENLDEQATKIRNQFVELITKETGLKWLPVKVHDKLKQNVFVDEESGTEYYVSISKNSNEYLLLATDKDENMLEEVYCNNLNKLIFYMKIKEG